MALELASCTHTSNMLKILPVFQKCEDFKTWGVNFQDYDRHGPIFTFSIGLLMDVWEAVGRHVSEGICQRDGWQGVWRQALSLCLNSGEG